MISSILDDGPIQVALLSLIIAGGLATVLEPTNWVKPIEGVVVSKREKYWIERRRFDTSRYVVRARLEDGSTVRVSNFHDVGDRLCVSFRTGAITGFTVGATVESDSC